MAKGWSTSEWCLSLGSDPADVGREARRNDSLPLGSVTICSRARVRRVILPGTR